MGLLEHKVAWMRHWRKHWNMIKSSTAYQKLWSLFLWLWLKTVYNLNYDSGGHQTITHFSCFHWPDQLDALLSQPEVKVRWKNVATNCFLVMISILFCYYIFCVIEHSQSPSSLHSHSLWNLQQVTYLSRLWISHLWTQWSDSSLFPALTVYVQHNWPLSCFIKGWLLSIETRSAEETVKP